MKGKTFLVLVILFVVAATLAIALILNAKKTKYADGTWVGQGAGRNGPIEVSLVIKNGKIQSAELVSMQESEYAVPAVTEILRQVVENNGAESYDAVSGATLSSKGTVQAARNALSKASLVW